MKKNTMQVIIIILLVILIVMVFGFGVYYIADERVSGGPEITDNDTNNTQNANSTNNSESSDVTTLSTDSELVKRLWDLLKIERVLSDQPIYEGLFKNKNVNIQDSSNLIKTELLWGNLDFEDREKQNNDAFACYKDICLYSTYPSSLIINLWHKLYGSDAIVPTDLEVYQNQAILYYFDSNSRLYVGIAGYEALDWVENTLVSAYQENDRVVLDVSAKFSKPNDDVTNRYYYSDYERTNKVTEDSVDPVNYRFIFKKDSKGNYYFHSVERVK